MSLPVRIYTILVFILSLSACVSFNPVPVSDVNFTDRAKTQKENNVRVLVSVLTNEESEAIFGINLALKFIQAVWVEIENNDDHPYWLVSSALDPEYFSPQEVAYSSHRFLQRKYNNQIDEHFNDLSFHNPITAHSTHSGFIFVNLDEDEKELDIDLISKQEIKFFDFYIRIPGLKTHTMAEIEDLYSVDEQIDLTKDELRVQLSKLPCCTTSQDGETNGDALNIVIIGNSSHLFPPFVRRGWHSAEDNYFGSVWKTINSFLFGKHYRYSPVSSLYYEGRKQDIALQKARGTIHQRNHLRLWLTPFRYQGKDVWIGQVSRDIGVRFTTHTPTFTTHKIDADIDETRTAFIEDMLFSQGLETLGFVEGVGLSTHEQPNQNLTGDPYFTDGLRAVLEFDRRPGNIEDVRFFDWATPPHRSVYSK
ncbi:MAG: hypothetical protein DRQ40_10195 [Gammaproteobacteria bacterium]|nr:MAG: hypothetical protein DRQ40_10195 [Gammaproteobacteria bacterium]